MLSKHGHIHHTKKEDNSSVTELDLLVEKELIATISALDPTVGFYGEEYGAQGNTERFWTIDPIDGTEAFIRGLPFCTNMLAYIDNGEVTVAVIYNFVLNEYYQAVRGKGTTLNGKRVQVSKRTIEHACVEFEIKHDNEQDRKTYFELPRFSTVKFSAAGFGFCQVASGRIEARVSYNAYGKIWDYAPGTLIVEEAGGTVANIGSSRYTYQNTNLIASNSVIHSDLQKYFKAKQIST